MTSKKTQMCMNKIISTDNCKAFSPHGGWNGLEALLRGYKHFQKALEELANPADVAKPSPNPKIICKLLSKLAKHIGYRQISWDSGQETKPS